MNENPPGLQLCPTRIDAAPMLFAHVVSPQMCQQRQRDSYHKCFTCVHNNAQVEGNARWPSGWRNGQGRQRADRSVAIAARIG
jgi:hypothetical protein